MLNVCRSSSVMVLMLIIIIVVKVIIIIIRRRRRRRRRRRGIRRIRNRRTFMMTMVMIMMTLILWVPFHPSRLLFSYLPVRSVHDHDFYKYGASNFAVFCSMQSLILKAVSLLVNKVM